MIDIKAVGAVVWDCVYLMGPLFILCGYPILKRNGWLGRPVLVVPIAFAFSSFFAYFYPTIWSLPGEVVYGFEHFYGGLAMFLFLYCLLGFRFGYSKLDAAVLSFLCVIAIDQLWQIPYDTAWIGNSQSAAVGLATAGFSLMSIPVLFYVLYQAIGRVRMSFAKDLLMIAVLLTGIDCLQYCVSECLTAPNFPYYLIVPWFAFFVVLFFESRSLWIPTGALR